MNGNTYTTGDIAKLCNVNQKTVQRWIKRGFLDSFQLPGRGDNRVEEKNLIHFLSQNNIPIPPQFQTKKLDVLIIDDEELLANSTRRILMKKKMNCQIATDGFQAGIALAKSTPDIITLDISMPGLSGFDIIRLVRKNEQTKHTKILVLSGLNSTVLKDAVTIGADDYLEKPYEVEHLIEKILLLTGGKIAGSDKFN